MCSTCQLTLSHCIIDQKTSSDYSAVEPGCITCCCYKLKSVQPCTVLPPAALQHCKSSHSNKYHKKVRAWNKCTADALCPVCTLCPVCILCPVCPVLCILFLAVQPDSGAADQPSGILVETMMIVRIVRKSS